MARGNRDFARMPNQTGRPLSSVPARQQLLKRHNLSLVLRQIAASRRLSRARTVGADRPHQSDGLDTCRCVDGGRAGSGTRPRTGLHRTTRQSPQPESARTCRARHRDQRRLRVVLRRGPHGLGPFPADDRRGQSAAPTGGRAAARGPGRKSRLAQGGRDGAHSVGGRSRRARPRGLRRCSPSSSQPAGLAGHPACRSRH